MIVALIQEFRVILKLIPPSNKCRGVQLSKYGNCIDAGLALLPMAVVLKGVIASKCDEGSKAYSK